MQYYFSFEKIRPPSTGVAPWASWQSAHACGSPSFSRETRLAWTGLAPICSSVWHPRQTVDDLSRNCALLANRLLGWAFPVKSVWHWVHSRTLWTDARKWAA